MRRVLAADLGGTKTALAVVDSDGGISSRLKVNAERDFRLAVDQLSRQILESEVDAAGIIVPGIWNKSSGGVWAPNLWGWDEVPLYEALAEKVTLPVVIECDRAGYVLGEQWMGVAGGLRDVIFVALGTGIGVGVMAAGRYIAGARGIAGAAGWWALNADWDPRYKECGCWEWEAAGRAIARMAGTRDAESAAAKAKEGDAAALRAWEHAARVTGRGVANLISIFNPEMVVLGGGLMQAGCMTLQAIREEARLWAQPIAFAGARLEVSALGENVGLLGAARLAFLLDEFDPVA